MLVGAISDTHGHFDERVVAAFEGVEAILHAGDVGSSAILERLREIAPVHAVRGNNDERLGGLGLPLRLDVELGGVRVHLVHQRPHARPGPGTGLVVFGHSHRALVQMVDGVAWVNPGAAGRVGFHRVLTVARLRLDGDGPEGGGVRAEVVELGARPVRRR